MDENTLNEYGKKNHDIKDEIYKIMTNLYHGIVKVDLDSGYALVLSSSDEYEVGEQHNWDEYLKKYVDRFLLPSDRLRAMNTFRIESLKEKFSQGEYSFSSDLAFIHFNLWRKMETSIHFNL